MNHESFNGTSSDHGMTRRTCLLLYLRLRLFRFPFRLVCSDTIVRRAIPVTKDSQNSKPSRNIHHISASRRNQWRQSRLQTHSIHLTRIHLLPFSRAGSNNSNHFVSRLLHSGRYTHLTQPDSFSNCCMRCRRVFSTFHRRHHCRGTSN
jgi:hypothetical protein